jgi:hypothetical protein
MIWYVHLCSDTAVVAAWPHEPCGPSLRCPPHYSTKIDHFVCLDHLVYDDVPPPRGRYIIHNRGTKLYKIATRLARLYYSTKADPQNSFTSLHTSITIMPRESSDARAALMTVYMSQRSSLFNNPPNPSTARKKLKAAERPPHRRSHEEDLGTTTVLRKDLNKSLTHRRRCDAGLGQGLARTGRTIYGGGEASRGIRTQRREGGLANGLTRSRESRTSQGRRAVERGKEMAGRDEEARRHMVAVREKEKEGSWKKADHTWVHLDKIGDNLKMMVGGVEWAGDSIVGAEEVAHADRYFDMYINVEACGGH